MENNFQQETEKLAMTNKQVADILLRHAAHKDGVITDKGKEQCRQAGENIIKIYADSDKPVIIRRHISNVVVQETGQNRTLNTANLVTQRLLEENERLGYKKFIFKEEPIIETDLSYGFEDDAAKAKMDQLMEKSPELKKIFDNDNYSMWESMGPLKILKEQTNTAQAVGEVVNNFVYNHLKEEFTPDFKQKYGDANVLNLNFSHEDLLDSAGKETDVFQAVISR